MSEKKDKGVLLRQWALLDSIPAYPQRASVKSLMESLEAKGFEYTSTSAGKRAIQRDLNTLSEYFALSQETEGNTNLWFWPSKSMSIQGMGPDVALALKMADSQLQHTLPNVTYDNLKPLFKHAEQVLGRSTNRLAKWSEKVTSLARGPSLAPAKIKQSVSANVQAALLDDYKLNISYQPRYESSPKDHQVHPLGLLDKDGVQYLVAVIDKVKDWGEPTPFAMHRIKKAENTHDPSVRDKEFDLCEYAKSTFGGYHVSDKQLKLELSFTPSAAKHLLERPLSDDQSAELEDEETIIKATVSDTLELRWWILGFGDDVEVLRPKSLRTEFKETANTLASYYKD